MKKYTAKDIAEQRISFKGLTKKQFKKLLTHFQKYYNTNETYHYYNSDISWRFYKNESLNSYFHGMSESYFNVQDINCQSNLEITFEEFDFEEEFVLPEYWYVVVTEENKDILSKWRGVTLSLPRTGIVGMSKRIREGIIKFEKGHNPSNYIKSGYDEISYNFGKEITFEQFKQYVLMENNKEIIGYKLIKPKYHQAVKEITGYHSFNFISRHDDVTPDKDDLGSSECYDKLKNAGVLDLWFEPVYKVEEEVYNMGSFNLTIKDNKIFHKTEDITSYVKGLVTYYTIPVTFGKKEYVANIKDITFSKTGCENNKTKLSDWINVYNKIK